jgi:hypothetical protein
VRRSKTSKDTSGGIRHPTVRSLDLPQNGLPAWIKDKNSYCVRVHATNGSTYFLRHQPTDGTPSSNGSYAFIRVDSQYQDGTRRELNRDLDADLQLVFGVDGTTWHGSDIFGFQDYLFILCTPSVAEATLRAGYNRHVVFVRAEKYGTWEEFSFREGWTTEASEGPVSNSMYASSRI